MERIQFLECDTCKKRAGMPELCHGCYVNRTAISRLEDKIDSLEEALNVIRGVLALINSLK